MVASAQAADLDKVNEALPAIPDGPITWMGVTFFGTIDVGYAYNSNGLPVSGSFFTGAAYTIFGNKAANGADFDHYKQRAGAIQGWAEDLGKAWLRLDGGRAA
jgi:hypothetical protein